MNKVSKISLILISLLVGIYFLGASCRPDLKGTIECPTQSYPGKELRDSIKVEIKNVGSQAANDFFVDLILSSDTMIPVKLASYSPNFEEDVLLDGGREHLESLAAGNSLDLTLHGANKIPEDTPPGIYYLGLVVDSGEKVSESSETNNTAICEIEIIECASIAAVTSCQIIEASGGTVGFARLRLRWTYGTGEKPYRLLITVFRRSGDTWDNIMPSEESFEVPSPETTTESDVTIFRLFSGDYRMVLKAFYTCEREAEYAFEQHL